MSEKKKVADMTEDFQDHIRRRDRYIRQLEADVCFPSTPPAFDAKLPDGPGETADAMEGVLAVIISTLVMQWLSHIEEPPGPNWNYIDEMVRGDTGSRWKWEKPYTENGQLAWCGHAQSIAERAARLSGEVVRRRLQSCHRLRTFAKEHGLFVPVDEMRRGDIVLVDTMGAPEKSDHITRCWAAFGTAWPDEFLAASQSASDGDARKYFRRFLVMPHYLTLEGNAKGLGPDGSVYEGLVARLRPLSTVREVIRIDRRFYDV